MPLALPPNILVFMSDQEQGAIVSPDHPCRTPHAERLAEEGIFFRNAYCPTAHCCPSRATFMTGLYPSRHGVYNNVLTPSAINRGLRPGVKTFSEHLRKAGYRLVFIGKWHVSAEENPAGRGWEEIVVTAGKDAFYRWHIKEWLKRTGEGSQGEGKRGRGEIFRPGWGNLRLYGSYPDRGQKGYEGLPDDQIIQAAIKVLDELKREDRPWFLYIGTHGPHDPYLIPERFARLYDPEKVPLPPSYFDTLKDKPRIYRRLREQVFGQLTPEEVQEAIAHYWGYCTMIDAMFGEVLEALEATGQADNTVVVRLSDHGDYAGAHGLFMKGVPAFREAYHIVAIVRWRKGIVEPGRVVDDFVTLADFAPTFLELAGKEPSGEDLTGKSLVPFLRGERPSERRDIFYAQFNGVELYYTQRVVQTRDFKYVFNGFDFDELYDLRHDPHEMVNLSDHPAYQTMKRDLVGKLWEFAAREGDELLFDAYGTVALLPWGPLEGLKEKSDGHVAC